MSRERFNPLKGMLAQQTDELLNDDVEQSEQKTIERIVEVTRPVQTDTDGVTWVGNICVTAMGLDLPEALTHEESETYKDGQVIEVVQTGYKLKDRIIRPAAVRVAK